MKAISSSATHGTDQGDGHQWVWCMVWHHHHHAGVGLWLCCVDGLLSTNPFFFLTLIHPLTPHQPLIPTTIPSIPCAVCEGRDKSGDGDQGGAITLDWQHQHKDQCHAVHLPTHPLVWLFGLWCHSSHSSTCVWDEGWDGNHCHFNATCGTHTRVRL